MTYSILSWVSDPSELGSEPDSALNCSALHAQNRCQTRGQGPASDATNARWADRTTFEAKLSAVAMANAVTEGPQRTGPQGSYAQARTTTYA